MSLRFAPRFLIIGAAVLFGAGAGCLSDKSAGRTSDTAVVQGDVVTTPGDASGDIGSDIGGDISVTPPPDVTSLPDLITVAEVALDTPGDLCVEPNAAALIGQPCSEDYLAICTDETKIEALCEGGVWKRFADTQWGWNGESGCDCQLIPCGPDSAGCWIVGFAGVARAGVRPTGGPLLRRA